MWYSTAVQPQQQRTPRLYMRKRYMSALAPMQPRSSSCTLSGSGEARYSSAASHHGVVWCDVYVLMPCGVVWCAEVGHSFYDVALWCGVMSMRLRSVLWCGVVCRGVHFFCGLTLWCGVVRMRYCGVCDVQMPGTCVWCGANELARGQGHGVGWEGGAVQHAAAGSWQHCWRPATP